MSEIKNLLFDLGGVIMNLDRNRCVKALNAIGLDNADEMLGLYSQQGPFMELEDGSISAEEFRDIVRNQIGKPVTDAQIDFAFNQFLLGIPVHRLKALEKLRKRYKVFMLSNTNPIMIDSDIREYFRIDGKEMDDYFDGLVLSYEAKSSKPDHKIFEFALSHLGIKAEETIFLDDSQKNIDSAAQLGFHTALINVGTEFVDVLDILNIK